MSARTRGLALLLLGLQPVGVAGQGLADRVAAAEGEVAFLMAIRPDVEVCDGGVRTDDGTSFSGRWRGRIEETCAHGPAEVMLTVRSGRVRAVEVRPAGSRRSDVSLGSVAAPEAAAYLLSLAGTADDRAAREALLPAAAADSVEVWPRLLEIGADRALDRDLRQSALFWVSRAAAEVVTRGLARVATDESDDEEVRKSAVFALSRRPGGEGVTALMDIARTAPGRGVREAALFWLARDDDPRVIPFFEEILLGARARQ